MDITLRPATSADLPQCAAILQDSPAYGTRLDAYLPNMWKELLKEKRLFLTVVEGKTETATRLLGFRCGCFLSEAFVCDLCAGLPPCLSEQIYHLHQRGASPILSRAEIAQANARAGLTSFAYTVHQEEIYHPDLIISYGHAISQAFYDMFTGYRLNESFVENYGVVPLEYMKRSGYKIHTEYADYYAACTDLESRFFVVHLSREEALQEQGTSLSNIFLTYNTPRFGFTEREQEMLEYALENSTESWLANRCCCAPITIKKRWESIYNRVEAYDSQWFVRQAAANPAGAEVSRRHLLLKYLRSHYEELRPYSIQPEPKGRR